MNSNLKNIYINQLINQSKNKKQTNKNIKRNQNDNSLIYLCLKR